MLLDKDACLSPAQHTLSVLGPWGVDLDLDLVIGLEQCLVIDGLKFHGVYSAMPPDQIDKAKKAFHGYKLAFT